MRPQFLAMPGLVVAASLAACAVTASKQNAPEARSVQSGARGKIAYFYNLTASKPSMARNWGLIEPHCVGRNKYRSSLIPSSRPHRTSSGT